METPEALRERLIKDHFEPGSSVELKVSMLRVQVEQVYQLARIAGDLEEIKKNGIWVEEVPKEEEDGS